MARARSGTDVFHVIADGTRRALIEALAEGEQSVGTLAERFDISLPAISQQLKLLREAGLVQVRAVGRQRLCRLQAEPLAAVADWVGRYQEYWRSRRLALDRHLEHTRDDPSVAAAAVRTDSLAEGGHGPRPASGRGSAAAAPPAQGACAPRRRSSR